MSVWLSHFCHCVSLRWPMDYWLADNLLAECNPVCKDNSCQYLNYNVGVRTYYWYVRIYTGTYVHRSRYWRCAQQSYIKATNTVSLPTVPQPHLPRPHLRTYLSHTHHSPAHLIRSTALHQWCETASIQQPMHTDVYMLITHIRTLDNYVHVSDEIKIVFSLLERDVIYHLQLSFWPWAKRRS